MVSEDIKKLVTKYRIKYNRFPTVINLSPADFKFFKNEPHVKMMLNCLPQETENIEIKYMGVHIKSRPIIFNLWQGV